MGDANENELVPVRRALLSVSDKTGLGEFASALHREFGVELISTGGTAQFLRGLGLPVTEVAAVTGFPEMLDGRVKTLHPAIHGGLLGVRDNPAHVAAMKAAGIEPIDLVCINLYPFEATIQKPGVTFEEAIENIDIGGPAMIRSAAKNHRFVLVVTAATHYEKVLGDLRKHSGASCAAHRQKQAQRAFAHTAEYDGAIAKYLAKVVTPSVSAEAEDASLPGITGAGPAHRFAENPGGSVASATDVFPDQAGTTQGRFARTDPAPVSASQVKLALTDLLTRQAVSAGGTEAAMFLILPNPSEPRGLELRPIAHIRPDDSDAKTRAAAIEAFQKLVRRCAEQDRDAAIPLQNPNENGSQYVLAAVLHDAMLKPFAISAVVVRTPRDTAARERLYTMKSFADTAEAWLALPSLTTDYEGELLPRRLRLDLTKQQDLRYGENPHQPAALYVDSGRPTRESVARTQQLHGKELSYINLLDADAALAAAMELSTPTACIVKHATPCGYATGSTIGEAFKAAYATDPLAAFGGIVAVNRPIDLEAAQAITGIDKLLEVIVAPRFDSDALGLLKERWKNVRLLAVGDPAAGDSLHMHKIAGGYLVQGRDASGASDADVARWKVVSKRQPTEAEMADLKVAWAAAKHVKSNAIVLAKDGAAVGIGGGQVDRVNACRIAVAKAGERSPGAVAASDAFFPFADGPELLVAAGVTALIHPGGSVRDADTLAAVDAAGAAMVVTGQRHFRH